MSSAFICRARIRSRWLRLLIAATLVAALLQVVVVAASGFAARANAAPPNGTGGLFRATQGRLVDTRNGVGGYGSAQPAGERAYSVTGVFGVPSTGVAAVAVTVTVINPSAQGYLLATADPVPPGVDSVTSLIWSAGDTTSNSTVVGVGSNGRIAIKSTLAVDLVVDLQGYYSSAASGPAPGGYVPVTPARLHFSGSSMAKNTTTNVPMTGSGSGVPADASAVYANVTVNNQTGAGWFTAYPAGGTRPLSSFNFPDAKAKAFGLTSAVSSAGEMAIYNGSSGPIDIIVDVLGYYTASNSAGAFTPWQTRVMDTRTDGRSDLASNSVATYQVAGLNQVPTPAEGVSAVLVDVLVIEPTSGSNGYIKIWPSDQSEPALSTVNVNPGHALGNQVAVAVGPDGAIKIRNNSTASVRIVLDVAGWFTDASIGAQPSGPLCPFSGQRKGSKPMTHALTDRSQMLLNPIDGNLTLTGTLLHLKGIEQDVSVSWRYNSVNDSRPTLSAGRFEAALRPWSNGDFSYVAPDGGCYRFTKNSGGSWDTPAGITGKLTSDNGTMSLRFDPGGVRNTYEKTGGLWLLTKSRDKNKDNPNTVSYAYAAAGGKLSSITDTQGRVVSFGYDDANNPAQPSTITDTSLNRKVTLAYGGPLGALTSITDAVGDVTTLSYDNSGLVSVTDGAGRKTAFAYGSGSTLIGWTFGAGSSDAATWQGACQMVCVRG